MLIEDGPGFLVIYDAHYQPVRFVVNDRGLFIAG